MNDAFAFRDAARTARVRRKWNLDALGFDDSQRKPNLLGKPSIADDTLCDHGLLNLAKCG